MRTVLALCLLLAVPVQARELPSGYYRYGMDCADVQRKVFGIRAWSSVLLAQIEQESTWRPRAQSPYARGLSQFTPQTQRAVERQYHLSGNIWDVGHACLLQAYLMRDLARQYAPLATGFENEWGFALRAYNGSPAAFLCEHRRCGRPRTLAGVKPCRCRRSDFHTENTRYPERILFTLYPEYRKRWGA